MCVIEGYTSNEALREQMYAVCENCATVFQPCGTHNTARRVDFVLHSKFSITWPTSSFHFDSDRLPAGYRTIVVLLCLSTCSSLTTNLGLLGAERVQRLRARTSEK